MNFEYIYHKEITSTQKHAIDLIQNNKVINKSVIYTDCQTSGVGRSGFQWASDLGNLMMSIILPINVTDQKNINTLSIKIGLLIVDILKKMTNYKIQLKWPNDIMLNNCKVGGIIVNFETRNTITYCIIGIGINLIKHPDIINQNYDISSILKETNIKISRDEILKYIVDNIDLYLNKSNEEVMEKYRKIAIGVGRIVKINDTTGRINDFSNNGGVCIESSDNKIIELTSGSLIFLD